MKRIIGLLIGVPVFVVLAALALANRGWVTISLDPVTPDQPFFSFQLPLWSVFMLGVLIGLIAGGVATWLRQGKWRARARDAAYQLEVERMNRARAEEAQKPVAAQPDKKALPAA